MKKFTNQHDPKVLMLSKKPLRFIVHNAMTVTKVIN